MRICKTTIVRAAMLVVLFSCCLLAAACNGNKGKAGDSGGQGSTAESVRAETHDAGIDFVKTTVGLKSHTLDYVGPGPDALAGAKASGKIYFGEDDAGKTQIYCRDLNTGQRSAVLEIPDFVSGSMICSADGRYLTYGTWKFTDRFIDNPNVTYPERIAVLYRYDIKEKKEELLFDYKLNEYQAYRTDNHDCFISADGSRIVTIAYDLDSLIMKKQLMDWLAMANELKDPASEMTEPDKNESLNVLRQLYNSPRVKKMLEEAAVSPPATGAITQGEMDAMQDIYLKFSRPAAALLIWEDGASRILPVKFEDGMEISVHYIVGVSKERILLGTREPSPTNISPYYIYDTNMEDGSLTRIATYEGSPSVLELGAGGNELLMVYNPIDKAANAVGSVSMLRRIPLNGGEAVETTLPGNYVGYVDITTDGSMIVGQERTDHYLYAVDTASGSKKVLTKFVAEAGGLFLPDDKQHVSYLENGILYAINVSDNPEASPDWVPASYFDPYRKRFGEYLSSLGFSIPETAAYEFEENKGLGAHEIAATISNPANPGFQTFVRYSVARSSFVAFWMPQGYAFENTKFVQQAEPLDYYDCEDIAEEALNAVGWMNPDTREVYQPGPNPMLDGRTQTYVILFRDGYYMGEGDDRKWVINKEATVAVRSVDGALVEMTINEREQVPSQPLTVTLDAAVFTARNKGTDPIPSNANVRFDTENYRLIVAQRPEEHFGPIKYQLRKEPRVCYEFDMFILPEDELVLTSLVDTESGELMGQLNYTPTSLIPEIMQPGEMPQGMQQMQRPDGN